MALSDWVYFLALIWLLDKLLIIRKRYRIAIESHGETSVHKWYLAIWIYCKMPDEDYFWRRGGRRLFHLERRKKLFK